MSKQRLVTFLWFDKNGEEAVNHYKSIFKEDLRITGGTRWGKVGPGPEGSVLTVDFELWGQRFVALNGGPQFKFTEAVSILVECETQEEIDYYWEKLAAGGSHSECGWLKDKYGLSWQVCPRVLLEMIQDKDRARADRVMAAMMTMKKIDLGRIRGAYEGR